MKEGLKLLVDSRPAGSRTAELVVAWKILAVSLGRGEVLPGVPALLKGAVLAITASPLKFAER